MRKIKKGYNLKIIVLMLGIVFLCNNILYSCPVDRGVLRVPSIFQNSKHNGDGSVEPEVSSRPSSSLDNSEGPMGTENPVAVSSSAASKLVETSEALSIIADRLRAGEIVIFGDMHRGERIPQDDAIWDHELFLDYVEQLREFSMNFSVALELPHQLEDKLNDPSVSVEDFLDEYYKLLSAKNSVELARANSQIRRPYLSRLLSTLKRFNIPVILIDDINSQRGGLGTDIDVIERSNKDMARKLLEGRKKYSNDSVLLMVGRNHVVPKISSIWLGGHDMNSIPGVLRESGTSVKLVRPDDFQYDKEDLTKFDLIIKVDGKRQKEYLVRHRDVSLDMQKLSSLFIVNAKDGLRHFIYYPKLVIGDEENIEEGTVPVYDNKYTGLEHDVFIPYLRTAVVDNHSDQFLMIKLACELGLIERKGNVLIHVDLPYHQDNHAINWLKDYPLNPTLKQSTVYLSEVLNSSPEGAQAHIMPLVADGTINHIVHVISLPSSPDTIKLDLNYALGKVELLVTTVSLDMLPQVLAKVPQGKRILGMDVDSYADNEESEKDVRRSLPKMARVWDDIFLHFDFAFSCMSTSPSYAYQPLAIMFIKDVLRKRGSAIRSSGERASSAKRGYTRLNSSL